MPRSKSTPRREAAFELIADLARRPTFTDHFLTGFHLTRLDARGEGAGARFRVKAPLRSPWEDTTLVELDAPFKIDERGTGGRVNRIPNHTVWEIEPGQAGMTLVRVTHWTSRRNRSTSWSRGSVSAPISSEKAGRRRPKRLRDILEAEGPGGERIAVAGGNRYATGIP